MEALKKINSDRAVQTYNDLVQKVEADLHHFWDRFKDIFYWVQYFVYWVQYSFYGFQNFLDGFKDIFLSNVSYKIFKLFTPAGFKDIFPANLSYNIFMSKRKLRPRAASPTPQDALPSTPTTGRLR